MKFLSKIMFDNKKTSCGKKVNMSCCGYKISQNIFQYTGFRHINNFHDLKNQHTFSLFHRFVRAKSDTFNMRRFCAVHLPSPELTGSNGRGIFSLGIRFRNSLSFCRCLSNQAWICAVVRSVMSLSTFSASLWWCKPAL